MLNEKEFRAENYTYQPGVYNNKEIIWILFEYNTALIAQLKQNLKARWSRTNKKWYVADTAFHRELFGLEAKYFSQSSLAEIATVNQYALQKFIEQLKLRTYSPNTIKTYTYEFIQLRRCAKSPDFEPIRVHS